MPSPTRQHLADLGDFGLGAEIGDLALENGGNFCGADIHQPTSFMRVRMALSLVLSEPSTMREPSWTISPPMIEGSTLTLSSTSLPPEIARSDSFSAATFSSESGVALVTCGARHAAEGVVELAVIGDHVANGEQAPLGGDEADEIGGDAGDAGLVEQRAERLELVRGGKHRAAHQALQIRAFRRSCASNLASAAATSAVSRRSCASANRAEA